MPVRNVLYKREVPVNQSISVVVPKVGEILKNEDYYYDLVGSFTAMPIDKMVSLDDAGIDFSKIDEYQLFILMFEGLKKQDTHLILGDLDLSKFEYAINPANNQVLLIDTEHDIKIDKYVHSQIADTLREIHNIKKDVRKPGNEEARKFLIERARKKLKRNKNRKEESQLESLIIAMVCTEQYKYDFEGTLELSIYQFNECVRQIIKKVAYDNRMYGIYAGTVNANDLSPDELNWLTHK